MTLVAPPAYAANRLEMLRSLKEFISRRDPRFFEALRNATAAAHTCEEALLLASLGKRAAQQGFALAGQSSIRIAILGGYTPFPLNELLGHFLAANGPPTSCKAEFLLGDYDNYVSEIVGEFSRLDEFKPEVILFLPSDRSKSRISCALWNRWI